MSETLELERRIDELIAECKAVKRERDALRAERDTLRSLFNQESAQVDALHLSNMTLLNRQHDRLQAKLARALSVMRESQRGQEWYYVQGQGWVSKLSEALRELEGGE